MTQMLSRICLILFLGVASKATLDWHTILVQGWASKLGVEGRKRKLLQTLSTEFLSSKLESQVGVDGWFGMWERLGQQLMKLKKLEG
jgi:hypothetical protein